MAKKLIINNFFVTIHQRLSIINHKYSENVRKADRNINMIKIAYYISDHGYGHATRDIAIIRELLEHFDDIKISICTSEPLEFLKRSLVNNEERINFRDIKNDFGYCVTHDLKIHPTKTKRKVKRWLNNWQYYIKREMRFLKKNKINILISDIPPQPLICASKLKIPSIAVTNFTWYEVYKDLFSKENFIKKIKEAYTKADKGLILPFETGNLPFKSKKRIGLISRKITKKYKQKRKEMGVNPTENLVFVGVGKSYFNTKKTKFKISETIKKNYSFLTSSGYDLMPFPHYEIPDKATESQNYINACDFVISKFGYGVVSEALRGKIPMALTTRGIIEDVEGIKKLKKYNLAIAISRGAFFSCNWSNIFNHLKKLKYDSSDLPGRYTNRGEAEIVNQIKYLI